MFCDSNRIANFFVLSKTDADSLKKKLCTDPWKNYVIDLVRSFGIYDVKDNVSNFLKYVNVIELVILKLCERLFMNRAQRTRTS